MDSKQQTLRLTGLPRSTQFEDVEKFFNERIDRRGRRVVESIGSISQAAMSDKMQTTVSFSSRDAAEQALRLKFSNRRLVAFKGGAANITLNDDFKDITTLHTSRNPETGRPDIDVVALHGLTGHAWNTFTTSEVIDKQADRTREHNWLRDSLPEILEQHRDQKIYSRVMSFGYNADVWMTKSVADLDDPVTDLLHYLEVERQEDPSRPLFFIGHSLGGIVIKQAIAELATKAMIGTYDPDSPTQISPRFPVKGCMFFGVPHKGAEVADKASMFLSVLGRVFNKINANNVIDLKPKSQRFANISIAFQSAQSTWDIPVISFYETVQYPHFSGLIVDKDSAIFDYPRRPRAFAVDRDHKAMVKFSNNDDHALKPAVLFLATIAATAVKREKARTRPKIVPPPPPAPVDSEGQIIEDTWSILEGYDTVFLIDDSPSMRGEKWELVQQILDYSTVMAARYDPNGIDVHFMNNTMADQDSIKDPEIAAKIHHSIELRGSTPTLDKLSRHLGAYLRRFEAEKFSPSFKGYNLIVLTDGEPNKEYESEDEISDPEDAKKTPAAFRLIRKKIVAVAKKLDQIDAERTQVGIQFCQIGNDDDATNFFQFLDDRVRGKYKLKRDIVDMITCKSELDLTHDFYEKLLRGAIDKRLDRKKLEAHDPVENGQGTPSALPHRFQAFGQSRERPSSGDETLVGSPSRYDSVHGNRASVMDTLNDSPIDDTKHGHVFAVGPSTNARYTSPPSFGSENSRRNTILGNGIPETEEPEPKTTQRASIFHPSIHPSRWRRPRNF